MFRKIEVWILYLAMLLSIVFAIGFGVLVRQELVGNIKAGWLSKTALALAEIPLKARRILDTDIDLKTEDRFPDLVDFNGTPNTEESYLLLSRYDGDLREGVIELVNLRSFETLHTWNPDIDLFNDLVEQVDEFEHLKSNRKNSRQRLVHPKLTKDGGIIFGQFLPLTKINSCSDLIFQNTKDKFHHSIETDIDGNIWVPSQKFPQSLPSTKVGRDTGREGGTRNGFNDDAIVKLSPEGEVLYEKSVSQIFIDNGLEYLLFSVGDKSFNLDPIHLNDIQPVNFDGEFWKKGDVFLSLRNQSMILLYRPLTNEILWKGVGPFFYQHDVDILDENRISIFNNNAKNFVDSLTVDGNNEVVIYDFKTNKYSKYLNKSLIENDVRTKSQGRSEILPNGDLYIEETNFGRTLYFNSDGSLRWTHVNRADNENIYSVGWSRILYTEADVETVHNFLTNRGTCNE